MKRFFCVIITMMLLGISTQSYAIDNRVIGLYENFQKKLQTKYTLEEQEGIYKKVDGYIGDFLLKTNDAKRISLLKDLRAVNNEGLYELWYKNEYAQGSQKIFEISYRKTLKNTLDTVSISDFAAKLHKKSSIEFVATNDAGEFLDGNDIYKVSYTSYIPFDSSNASWLNNKSGIIIKDSQGKYRFIENYSYVKKIPYSELSTQFKTITDSFRVTQGAQSFLGYNFTRFHYLKDDYGTYETSLEHSGFNRDFTLIFIDDTGKYNFVNEYEVHELASVKDMYGVSEKHIFLDYLRDDSKFKTQDISSELSKIKAIADSLTKWKNTEESIKAIYAWILDNVQYSENIDLQDQKIFSAIETFKNKSWVCTGYTKLSVYLFLFAGLRDAEVIRGHVIDAQDFPNIWHAWVRIGDYYYDPTFDDPVGSSKTREFADYKYFKLPRDIFYANRFEYGDLPESFKTASDEEIRQYIFNYLSDLTTKYQGETHKYKVFAPVMFRNMYGISANTKITPEVLAGKIGNRKVENDSFMFEENGETRRITSFQFYKLTNDNTEIALKEFDYNLDNIYLFDWQTASGNREWRLAYNVEIQ